jgi:hypothetical protein
MPNIWASLNVPFIHFLLQFFPNSKQNGTAIFVILKPLLSLVFTLQKCANTFVNWYYNALRSNPNQDKF